MHIMGTTRYAPLTIDIYAVLLRTITVCIYGGKNSLTTLPP